MLVDEFVKKIKEKIDKRIKNTFIISLCIGIITHLYAITNLLYNGDGVVSMYWGTDGLTSGRWALKFACNISGEMQTPVTIGLLSILYLSIVSCLIVNILELESYSSILLLSGSIMTFPTITATFSYLFTMDAYMFSLLLAVLSVYITKKFKYGFLCSCVILSFSLGIYQSYLCVAIGLYLCMLMVNIISGDKASKVFIKGIQYLVSLSGGLILYYVILNISLKAHNAVLNNYRGINEMGHYSLNEIPALLKETVVQVWNYFFVKQDFFYVSKWQVYANWILLILGIFAFLYTVIRKKIYKNLNILILGGLLVLFPIGINFMQIANKVEQPHALMLLGYAVFYWLVIKIIEHMDNLFPYFKFNKFLQCIGCISMIVIIFLNFDLTQRVYLRLELRDKSSFAFANRLVYSIEESDDYNKDTPVYIYGHFNYEMYPTQRRKFDDLTYLTGTSSDYIFFSSYHLEYYLRDTINMDFKQATNEEKRNIEETIEFNEMPCYPEMGSVKLINNVLVVKLSN